jgi:uroporphyrinogen decarboxylase
MPTLVQATRSLVGTGALPFHPDRGTSACGDEWRTREDMISKAENLRHILRGEASEWIPVECWSDPRGDGAYALIPYTGAHAPSQGGYDLWGVRWAGTGEHLPYPVEHPVASLEEALTMSLPDIHDPVLWEEPRARAEATRGDSVPIAWQPGGIWERFWFLLGMEKGLISLVTEPELAAALLRRITDWQIAAADHFIDVGMEAARISDDYGTQSSLLMSPDTWRKLIYPQLARLVGHYQKAGIPVILHSCGNLSLIMEDLVGLEFAAFNMQTTANDLVAMREKYGPRLCIWGGISTQSVLAHGNPDQVKVAVREAIRTLGQGGGLVLEPDQLVTIPEENLSAFFEEARRLQKVTT